jgi:two-component system, NtrC family, sensor kinase
MGESDMNATVERLTNLGHLSAGVGHHVINAFSAIVSNAELLRLKPSPPAIADPVALADTIIQTALDAATVARRLIDYTRLVTSIDPERSAVEPSSVALDRMVGDVVASEQANRPQGVSLVTDLAPTPPIQGHPSQLRALLGHLIANAHEAMHDRVGTISISTATDARGWVVLEVRDTGQGMEAETLVRAVEPFFSTKPGHLGIGLSIANGIWRRHRGTLSIRSQLGEGTQLRLCVEPTPR